MIEEELNHCRKIFANTMGVPIEKVRAIPKNELEVGAIYQGYCRNAEDARWNGKKFVYKRCKFGDVFDEEINHYEDDDGYDVFVPMKII